MGTMEGSGTIVIQSPGGKLGNTTVPPTHTSTELNLFQSYDYETMNMAMRQLTNMTQRLGISCDAMARSSAMQLSLVAVFAHVYCASGECIHDKWSMPSQTMEGSGTIVFQSPGGKLGNITVPPTHTSTELNLFQSYDYETMNMATRQLTNMTQGSIH